MAIEAPIRRFADPDATDVVTLPGSCSCPGQPHERDTATFRTQLGGGERQSFAVAGYGRGSGGYFDWEAAQSELVAAAVTSWTLLDKDGEPIPITFDVVHRRLDSVTRKTLADAIDKAHEAQIEVEKAHLPNASGAPSRDSSRGSASRGPRTRKSR